MKVLIIGSSGLLGSKLLDKFSRKTKTLGTYFSRPEKAQTYKNVVHLDVTKHQVVEKFVLDFRPDVVIYCASITRPDVCELEQEKAHDVNVKGLINVASICSSFSLKLVYISADFVFAGGLVELDEEDSPNPINYFGETKKIAEDYLNETLPSSLIIRSGLIYGYSPYTEERGFFHYVIENLIKGKEIEVDDEITVYPILADDISDSIFSLIQKNESGIFHVANNQVYTKFSFAKAIANEYSLNDNLIKSVPTKSKNLPAMRPTKVYLKVDKLKRVLKSNFNISSVQEGIAIHRRQYGCLFRMIYSVRSDMLVAGQNASQFRISVGGALAKEAPVDKVDCVIPIPESGIYSATGLAAESGKPLFFGIIRDYFTEKTLYSSTSKDRHQSLKKKLIPIRSVVEGKSIALVDEAVLSGETLKVVVQRLKDSGVKEIHVRIPSPAMTSDCTGRVLPQVKLMYEALLEEFNISLMTKSDFEEKLVEKFEVNSFSFLSTDAFLDATRGDAQIKCYECFLKKEESTNV